MRKILAWILFLAGSWMLVSPQALTGLKQLKWMYEFSFAGEVLVGIAILSVAFYLFDIPEHQALKNRKH